MIGNNEGALSSRRKRAVPIIRTRSEKSSEKDGPRKESAGCSFTAEKGENEGFHWYEAFSSRPKKT
jgi:hypothetical protein